MPSPSLLTSLALTCLVGALSASPSVSSTANGVNLLVNPGFEGGMTGWTVLAGGAADFSYGDVEVASTAVANHISGGSRLLRCTSGNARVEQIVQVGPLAAGERIRAGGYFGGYLNSADDARILIRFLNSSNAEIGLHALPYVTVADRNEETVLLAREDIFEAPPNTDRIAVRVEFRNNSCCTEVGVADLLFLEVTTDSLTPAALPLNTELLVNANFDQGWSATSPLTLNGPRGWEGAGGQSATRVYSDTDPAAPALAVTNVISGGPRLLSHASAASAVHQRLDVRGNAAQIAAGLELSLSAYLGGVGAEYDEARIEVSFVDEVGAPTGAAAPLGPVSIANRNLQTIVMRRERAYLLPPSTAFVDIRLVFANLSCCSNGALADRISARLRTPQTPQQLPLLVNLVQNGGFESGDLANSPLQLNDAGSWFGTVADAAAVVAYGANSSLPGVAFANSNGLGGFLLQAAGPNPNLRKRLSLVGYDTEINIGSLYVDVEAWLGGHANTADQVQLDVSFFNLNQAPVGSLITLGPVTPAQRMNLTTLLQQNQSIQVPLGASEMEIALKFTNLSCCSEWGLADGVRVVLRDVGQPGLNYCITTPNSAGLGAVMSGSGSASVAANDLVLYAAPVPSPTSGIFFYGAGQTQAPFGNGFRCVTAPLFRLPLESTTSGVLSHALDLTANSTHAANLIGGSTWCFQAWFRDPLAGGSFFDLSDGYCVTFLP